ncbi:MAG: hypothetical protein CMP59_05215 [Flavobacteriales bacterium]|nr:hypothetical protein [Flavobacteriales bacterium]|tara:strand:- start:3367 stop:3966 length:600 start_codon:yes stop_codon:yes gene_type:complete
MTREELIQRILKIMRTKGAHAIRMSRLHREANISSKLIKAHFSSKEEVFEACMTWVLDIHKDFASTVQNDLSLNPFQKLIRIYKHGLVEVMNYHPSFFFYLKKKQSSTYKLIDDYTKHIFNELYLALLEESRNKGFLISGINLKVFCKTQLSQSQIILEKMYAEYYEYTDQVVKIQLLSLRSILKKEFMDQFDEELMIK